MQSQDIICAVYEISRELRKLKATVKGILSAQKLPTRFFVIVYKYTTHSVHCILNTILF